MKWIKKDVDYRLPVKSWCETVDNAALKQAKNLANHPATVHHIALMPDCHVGYGMPIGGVIAVKDAVIPNAVGVDIGCGMVAVETNIPAERLADMRLRRELLDCIKTVIPAGEGVTRQTEIPWEGFDKFRDENAARTLSWPSKLDRVNLGTLGGGNHFVEVQTSEEGFVWLMIHSGSRNLGARMAKYYHEKARKLNALWRVALPDQELAFLPIETEEGKNYFTDMQFALAYALENRRVMMQCLKEQIAETFSEAEFKLEVNIHHNYAAREPHYGEYLYVHRKGATRARLDELGIIPGSMGTPSYIVRGLGNPESFYSCSHGAGRVFGRSEACRKLTIEECDKAMEGICHDRWNKRRVKWGKKTGNAEWDLEEAPQAYKDIEDVIASELDLVEPLVKLRPLLVLKG